MEMKKLFILTFSILILLSGCDVLEEPYRKEGIQLNTSRKVLLEDYTGHRCPNCPAAGKLMKELKEVYGDNLVMMAVHATQLAKIKFGPHYLYDFTTETGDIWSDHFGLNLSGIPNGLINRKERDGSRIISPGSWATVIYDELNLPAEASIELEAKWEQQSRQISVRALTTIADPMAGEAYYVTVVLLEDSIIKPQFNNDPAIGPVPDILDYVHNHVLRMSFTGAWGVPINPQVVDTRNFTYTLDGSSDIVPENCRVIAFISNSNREVLQAEEIRLIP
jgi:hypothetical protein